MSFGSSHRLLLAGAALLVFIQLVGLLPSATRHEKPTDDGSIAAQERTATPQGLFKGFSAPDEASPDYSIRNFRYVSVNEGNREWQILASDADFYSDQEIVIARQIEAELYSDDSVHLHAIRITANEARYSSGARTLEAGGTVIARFPDGSELHSDYLRYEPATRSIRIPGSYLVHGVGPTDERTRLEFDSRGLNGDLPTGIFLLPSSVRIRLRTAGAPMGETTQIAADRAELHRSQGLLLLYSAPSRKRDTFVTLTRPGPSELIARARTMEVRLPPAENGKKASLIASEDVRIEEWSRQEPRSERPFRYSTSGRALFEPEEGTIVLTEYPQVYQDDDTMTGDLIRVDRKNDRVEVDNTNAISREKHD